MDKQVDPTLNQLVGKTIEEALEQLTYIKAYGGPSYSTVRPVEQDGQGLYYTCNMDPSRVNVAVSDGKITEVKWVG